MNSIHSGLKEYFRTLHHKKSIRMLAMATISMGLPFIGAWSCLVAPRRIRVEKVKVQIHNNLANLKGMTIAQISDLHYGPTNKRHEHFHKAIDLINAAHPDMIVLTGDYYQWDPEYLHTLPKILERLRAPLGVFGCLGNHDYGSCYPGIQKCDPFDHNLIQNAFDKNGIQILANQSLQLTYHNQPFQLVGMHDLWSGLFEPVEAFKDVNQELPSIVLSHNPDTAAMIDHKYDLMLSGHTHGGQISWPILGALLVPMQNRQFTRGLHQVDEKKQLYVNRGLGHTFHMRLNSIPEVSLIEIV